MNLPFRVVAVLSLLLAAGAAAPAQSILRVIPLPNAPYWNSAWGLTSSDADLYIASSTSDATNGRKVFRLNTDGVVQDSVLAPAGVNSNQGLARDSAGNHYYVRRYTAVATIMKLSPSGALLDSVRIPEYLGGAAWDGTHLWYSVYYPNTLCRLVKLDFASRTHVDSIMLPTRQPYGVAWKGGLLYYVENGFDGDPAGVFAVDPTTRDTVGFLPAPPDPSANGSSPRDVTFTGGSMWLLGEPVGASSGRVLYEIDPGGSGTPDINLTASLLDFGNVPLGVADTLSLLIQNTGNAQLDVDSIEVLLSGRFTSLLTAPVSVDPAGSVTLPVAWTPSVYGPDSAAVRIHSNDPDEGTKYIALRGFGVYSLPFISAPSGFAFGARRVNSSNSWKFTVQNQGGGQLIIPSLTLSRPEYRLDSVSLPIVLDSLARTTIRVWFEPGTTGSIPDTLRIPSNASNGPVTNIALSGTGDATPVPIAQPLWQYTVPNHPISNTDRLVKAVRAMNDITGDGKPEIIVSTSNYWTMAVNGNASVTTDTLWAFTTYIANFSAGSIGSTGDYSHQKALAVASDLNGDGYNDVVIGTGGGNEHVYALNGRNGRMLWSFGSDHPDSFGLGDFTGVEVRRDLTGDGVPDVVAAAAATESGGIGGRRSAYLFNGATGQLVWVSPLPGFTHGIVSVGDISGDGQPDVVGAVGQPSYKATAFDGITGALLWDFSVLSSTGGVKEVMEFPVPGQPPDIIVSGFWGPVYRVDGEAGIQLWSASTGGSGVMQFGKLPDVTGDGTDEVLACLLGGGARCINGATGATVWSLPTGNTMGIWPVPDLNQDSVMDVAIAVQNQGTLIVQGQDGVQLGLFPTGTNQTREVAAVPDMDGNYSWEIVMGGKEGNVALLSGGVNAGPTSAGESGELPSQISLEQNYPNPFNPSTTIGFTLAQRADVRMGVYDLLGREVRSWDFPAVPAGRHSLEWDGRTAGGIPAASGVYLYELRAAGSRLTRTMMLLK